MGLFHRIGMVDRFVIFDHVQAMGGRSWLSRNRILVQGAPWWLTLPVHKAGRMGQIVNQVEIDYQNDVVRKHLRTLDMSYGKCPHGAPYIALVERLYKSDFRYISAFNTAFIKEICRVLAIKCDFVSSTDLVTLNPDLAGMSGNELVLEICRAAGGTHYVSGDGCTDFIRPAEFEAAEINFKFQQFLHPAYRQRGAAHFVSHLSVLDALCNVGEDEVHHIVS